LFSVGFFHVGCQPKYFELENPPHTTIFILAIVVATMALCFSKVVGIQNDVLAFALYLSYRNILSNLIIVFTQLQQLAFIFSWKFLQMIQSQSLRTHLKLEVFLLHYNNQLLWTLVMVQTISMFQQFLHQFIYFDSHELFILSTWKKFIMSWTSSTKVHLNSIIIMSIEPIFNFEEDTSFIALFTFYYVVSWAYWAQFTWRPFH